MASLHLSPELRNGSALSLSLSLFITKAIVLNIAKVAFDRIAADSNCRIQWKGPQSSRLFACSSMPSVAVRSIEGYDHHTEHGFFEYACRVGPLEPTCTELVH